MIVFAVEKVIVRKDECDVVFPIDYFEDRDDAETLVKKTGRSHGDRGHHGFYAQITNITVQLKSKK